MFSVYHGGIQRRHAIINRKLNGARTVIFVKAQPLAKNGFQNLLYV